MRFRFDSCLSLLSLSSWRARVVPGARRLYADLVRPIRYIGVGPETVLIPSILLSVRALRRRW